MIDQLEQIHNLVPSFMNEGIKAGIVELVDSKVGDKQLYPYQTISSHEFNKKDVNKQIKDKFIFYNDPLLPSITSSCKSFKIATT